ncbi:MAG: redoxin domain-containing protein [Vicinamibacterales bacterium]|nr:redoxin domain-containing protein [Vicinamibacterales bacterium]MDP7478864.1 redoxin domain-containing protein [Vicinamibacterales bacterium]MDP7693624.1 redoxin domain-containing protein [Vicinamibacterales bacterium]
MCPTELDALGADVLAVSTDTIETHRRWLGTSAASGGVGPLRFPLGSDPLGAMSRAYQVCVELHGLALRGLFIIDPNSVVQYQVVHNMNVGRRTDEVIRVLTALQTGGLCGESWSTCCNRHPAKVARKMLLRALVRRRGPEWAVWHQLNPALATFSPRGSLSMNRQPGSVD